MAPPDVIAKDWYQDRYLVSTRRALLDYEGVNAVFDSDLMWWSSRYPGDTIHTLLDNSLCLGLYLLPESTSDLAGKYLTIPTPRPPCTFESQELTTTGKAAPRMIGLARVVTDYVTFAYLTDVYVMPEHQGKGLAKWMLRCLNEIVSGWPHMRHVFLFTDSRATQRLYEETLGMVDFRESATARLIFMERRGPGAVDEPAHATADLEALAKGQGEDSAVKKTGQM